MVFQQFKRVSRQ